MLFFGGPNLTQSLVLLSNFLDDNLVAETDTIRLSVLENDA